MPARTRVSAQPDVLQQVRSLFGLSRAPANRLDAHDLLVEGLPGKALTHLIDNLVVLRHEPSFEKAMGMSRRTVQRRREAPAGRLNLDQSDRAWKFAEILAKAIAVFGGQEEAERWMARPAVGLDQRRPIDLLATSAGFEMVDTLLTRLEYGVYT